MNEDDVDYQIDASTMPSHLDFATPPRLEVSGVDVLPFLIITSRDSGAMSAPTEVHWLEVPATRTLTFDTRFVPINVFFAGSPTVDTRGVPSADEQVYVECARGPEGLCAFAESNGQVSVELPSAIAATEATFVIVQAEWGVLGTGEPPEVESLLVSYAVRLVPVS